MNSQNFFEPEGYFFKQFYSKTDQRYWTWKIALGLLLQTGGKNIVETGCLRQEGDWGGGYSTYVLGDFAKRYDKHLWTCDIDENCMEVAKRITKPFARNITYEVNDSRMFLRDFKEKIDLLVLDSVDCEPANKEITEKAQIHQLREILEVFGKLSPNAIILLDDNNFPWGGKTKLVKQWLSTKKFWLIMDWQHSLWMKK